MDVLLNKIYHIPYITNISTVKVKWQSFIIFFLMMEWKKLLLQRSNNERHINELSNRLNFGINIIKLLYVYRRKNSYG